MIKKPFSVNKDILAAKALNIMNEKKLHVFVFMETRRKIRQLE